MKTIYLDVYFLINFTVDLLALHFASAFSKVPIKNYKLIIAATLGGLYAIALVFIPQNSALFLLSIFLFLLINTLICVGNTSAKRKLKFVFSFFIFLTLIGGIVYFSFNFIDRYLTLTENSGELQNRTLLLLSIAILFSIGLIKLIFIMFGGTVSEKYVTVKIILNNTAITVNAFVDSGNTAIDPIDLSPVLFLKRKNAEKLFAGCIPEFQAGNIPEKYRSIIRLIPISKYGKTEILYGFRADSVRIVKQKTEECIKVTIALDKEGGTYCGYEALMPSAALENL